MWPAAIAEHSLCVYKLSVLCCDQTASRLQALGRQILLCSLQLAGFGL